MTHFHDLVIACKRTKVKKSGNIVTITKISYCIVDFLNNTYRKYKQMFFYIHLTNLY